MGYAYAEDREARKDLRFAWRKNYPARVAVAEGAARSARLVLVVHSIFLGVGVIVMTATLLPPLGDFSDTYRVIVRILLVAGQFVLLLDTRTRRKTRKEWREKRKG